MDHFNYQSGELFAESLSLRSIAEEHGTPCYVYSRATFEAHWHAFDQAFGEHPHLICYAVKANSNIAVLNVLAKLGSGFDIVSLGELERVLAAKGEPGKIVFSGLGKQAHEIRRALQVGIRCFNIESEAEIELINSVASELDIVAPVSVRINPDVDPQTHPYISTGLKENKFGLEYERALPVYQQIQQASHLNPVGLDCHIGSQLTNMDPFVDAMKRMLELIDALAANGINIQHLDFGGGLGVCYQDETPPLPKEYAETIMALLKDRDIEIILEPGRAIAANAGVMLTQVNFLKKNADKNFAVVDGAMNDMLRPALYQAWQAIIPLNENSSAPSANYDIVGPVCESGDFLGKDRELQLQAGDYLAVRSAGAYGFVMASNYNTRNRPPEILVDGNHNFVVRRRETFDDQLALENLLPD